MRDRLIVNTEAFSRSPVRLYPAWVFSSVRETAIQVVPRFFVYS
jgi:hypothetical protein